MSATFGAVKTSRIESPSPIHPPSRYRSIPPPIFTPKSPRPIVSKLIARSRVMQPQRCLIYRIYQGSPELLIPRRNRSCMSTCTDISLSVYVFTQHTLRICTYRCTVALSLYIYTYIHIYTPHTTHRTRKWLYTHIYTCSAPHVVYAGKRTDKDIDRHTRTCRETLSTSVYKYRQTATQTLYMHAYP